ncbi:MAG: hypothetical protein WCI21_00660 [Alphaproteobacteria bacterium]
MNRIHKTMGIFCSILIILVAGFWLRRLMLLREIGNSAKGLAPTLINSMKGATEKFKKDVDPANMIEIPAKSGEDIFQSITQPVGGKIQAVHDSADKTGSQ